MFRKIGRSVKRVSKGKSKKMYKKAYKPMGLTNSVKLNKYAGYPPLS